MIAAALGALASPAAAQRLQADKPVYLVGSPMRVTYEAPQQDNVTSPLVGIFRVEDNARLDYKGVPAKGRGQLEFAAPADLGRYELRLIGKDNAVLARQGFTTEVTPMPGALRVPKAKFVAGESFAVTATLPKGRYYHYPWIGLFRAGERTKDGAVLSDERLDWKRAEDAKPASFAAPASPGRYELRLFDRDSWHYILDSVAIEVEVLPVAGALSLPKKKFVAGEAITVTAQLPPGRYYHYPWVGLFQADDKVDRGGAGIDRNRLDWKRVDGAKPIAFTAPAWPGRYEFRVFDRDNWQYLLDTIAFEVEVPPIPGALSLPKTKFVAGEAMTVTAQLPAGRYYHYPWVGLFQADDKVDRGGAGIDRNRLDWKRVDGAKPIAFTAPAWPGRYEFRVFDRDNWQYLLDTIAFEVEVPPVPGALSLPKKKFVAGEAITVTAQLPPGRYYHYPWVGLFQADDKADRGGAGIDRNRLDWKRVDGAKPIAFTAPAWPGRYEFRVFDRDNWQYLLDTIAFEVEVPPVPGALSLPKAQFVIGEAMTVTAQLPAGRYYHYPWVGLFQADDKVDRGGAGIDRNRLDWKRVDGAKPIAFTAPAWPGRYEFRVFDRDNWQYLLDTIPFEVIATAAPAALRPEKQVYAPGEQVRLLIDLPRGRYFSYPWVGLYTTGIVVAGGARTGESRVNHWQFNMANPRLAFEAPRAAGLYELRLFDRDSNLYVLAIAPIEVRDPQRQGDARAVARLTPMPGTGGMGTEVRPPRPVTDGLPAEPPVLPDRTGDRGKQPSLRFVSTSANGFSPLRELAGGQSFLVEATFPEPPKEDSFTVQLAADDGTQRSVTVFRSADDPKLFRSGVIALEAGR